MPYIDPARREELDWLSSTGDVLARTPGELNFILTQEVQTYLATHGKSYTTFNEVIGVLSCMIQEIYRRLVAPYEDEKIEENGDVF